jgi:beta-glucuronidase
VGGDDQYTRFGIRTVGVRGPAILWNGAAIKLRGVNRHEDHPDWGSAMPAHLVRQDIEIIKRLGANAVRSHYPPTDLLLDYCDQAGLLFLDEVPSWQYRREQLASPAIQEKIRGHFRAMVEKDGGHASILTWSIGNEWPEPDQSYDVVKSLVEYARSVDRSHLITLVTGGPNVWRVQQLLDVVAVNWAQYQWYDPITYLDRKEGEKSIADVYRIHERYPEKPVILTEFGGSEAQAGWHNWGNVKWSEEYQARNVEDSARYALDQPWLSGGCVWQFSDARSAPERMLAGRLHGWNGKGVVDAQRNPKLAYFQLQRIYRGGAGK